MDNFHIIFPFFKAITYHLELTYYLWIYLFFIFTGRRSSESSSNNGLDTSNCELHNGTNGYGSRSPAPRRESKTPTPPFSNISNIFSRKTSESLGLSQNGSRKSSLEKSDLGRKPSNELSSSELAGKTSAFLLNSLWIFMFYLKIWKSDLKVDPILPTALNTLFKQINEKTLFGK